MAARKDKGDIKRAKRAFGSKIQWVANNLSDEKLTHADTIAPAATALMEFIHEAVDAGIDIKVGWDSFSNCYQATAIGAWDGFPSAGYALSARSSRDPHDALVLVWYKVVVMAEGDLSNLMTDDETDNYRG